MPRAILVSEFNFLSPAWILTWVVFAGTLITLFIYDGTSPTVLGTIHIGLSLASTVFAACWFCIATHWKRIPVALFVFFGLGLIFGYTEFHFDWFLFLLPFFVALPVLLTIELTKLFCSGRFARLEANNTDNYREGIQFGIRHLVLLTTAVAIMCGLWNALAPLADDVWNSAGGIFQILALIGGTISLYTLLSVWSLLGRWKIWRFGTMLLLGSVAIASTVWLAASGSRGFWIAMFVICWIALIILLTLLRIEGYRFVKKRLA